MKPSEIQVGKTYTNKGAGRAKRTVLAIGEEHNKWYGSGDPPSPLGVFFRDQSGREMAMNLMSFARWAGREVES